jgi:ABC-2 type transport system permease protein
MSTHPKNQPSFSPGFRWKIGLNMVARTILVLAVVVMVNYLGGFFFGRFYLSSQTRVELSSRTISVLHSLTNRITVTLYYNRQDDFYPAVVALLNEYHSVNPNISVKTVDYVRDAGEAEKIKERYKLNSPTDKNLIIFECPPAKPSDGVGPFKIANGDALIQYGPGEISKDKKLEFRPVAFRGEMMFSSLLLSVINPNPFKAYFLQGHGEPSLTDNGETGYTKFAFILGQNYIQVQPLELLGDNPVPADYNLLIIAGPRTMFSNLELQKIDQYLLQGGRLLVLLDYSSIQHPTGIEDILKQWNVNVGTDTVRDLKNTTSSSGADVTVRKFSRHPVVNPLTQSALQMILPRPVSCINRQNLSADAPKVDELAFSGPDSVLVDERGETPRSYPLMVAVEQNPVKGIANPHGGTRIVVVGDSIFLNNSVIEGGQGGANRDFVGYAVNWLLDRPTLLEGVGPRPVTEFRLIMTRTQQRNARWLLLGVLPGSILTLGGLTWLRRRK